jgi:cell division protein FtsB
MVREDRKGASWKRKILLAAVGFFFLVLLISSLFGKKGLIEIYKARRNYDLLLQEVKRLEAEKARLEREIEDLKNNPGAVEREAREKLWLIRPDEKVIVKRKEEKR